MFDDKGGGTGFVWALVVCSAIGGFAVFGVLVWIMPAVVHDCARAGVELPLFTQWLLRLGSLLGHVWFFSGPIALLGPLGLLIIPRSHAARIGAGLVVTQLGIAILAVLAVFMPYHKIAEGIAAGHASTPTAATSTASPTR